MITYNTYIFDLDGTLLDTLTDLAASTNYALRTHGMPEHTIDEVRRFVGNGVRKLMERAVPDGTDNPLFDEAFATFRQYYMEHSLDTTRPYEGVPEMLAALKAKGCHLAEEIIARHLYCPSMLCILSMQDWLAMDTELRSKHPRDERINVPSDPYNHWKYRMHLPLEDLIAATKYNNKVRTMIQRSKR